MGSLFGWLVGRSVGWLVYWLSLIGLADFGGVLLVLNL